MKKSTWLKHSWPFVFTAIILSYPIVWSIRVRLWALAYFLIMVILINCIISYKEIKEIRQREKINHLFKQDDLNLTSTNSLMVYDSNVYLFKDYWSDREKLGRNKQDENTVNMLELIMEEGNDKCHVRGIDGRFKDLVNPFNLAQKYEPNNIVVNMLTLGTLIQLPTDWIKFNTGGETTTKIEEKFARARAKLGWIVPEEVNAEPIVQAVSDLKQFNFNNPLIFLLSAGLFFLLESSIISFLTKYFPWLKGLTSTVFTLTLIVFICLMAWLFISSATKEVTEATAKIFLYDGEKPEGSHYRHPFDMPSWLGSKPYWVIRYLFIWPRELTVKKSLPLIHLPKDQERVEVWSDAKTGNVEWIVSDYHWRELWYKAGQNLRRIYVWVYPDFHTLLPFNIAIERKGELKNLYVEEHPLKSVWINHVDNRISSHPIDWIKTQCGIGFDIGIASTLSTLWWDHWRYPRGIDSGLYNNGDEYPATGEQPTIEKLHR